MTLLLSLFIVVFSLILFAVALANLWWMLHAWRDPITLDETGFAETDGPPRTVTLPAALARRAMSWICAAWMCMPLTRTTSAQAKSAALAGAIFSSMKRTGHCAGI